MVAIWDTAELVAAVHRHRDVEARLIAERPLPPLADPDHVAATLDATCAELLR